MKVAEAVPYMTKSHLHRVIDNFTKDFPKTDEDRSRTIIVKNVAELTDSDRIARQLSFEGKTYAERELLGHVLAFLVNQPEHTASEESITSEVVKAERAVLKEARSADALRFEDPHAVDVYRSVLKVAIEDDRITAEELNLLRRLREKLGLGESTKKILLAQLKHYPRKDNKTHTASELRDALGELQRTGVMFYCNKLKGGLYIVPDEVVPGLRSALGIEMADKPWILLLNHLNTRQLATILEYHSLPQYGKKEDRVGRVLKGGVRPSKALGSLSSQELYDICKSLPGANVSGSKQQRIDRIIDYFAGLVVKEIAEEATPAERYYEYLVELAHRDRENLLTNKIIKKDKDMDAAFEKGAQFLFRQKLGLELLPMAGSDHADGKLEFRPGGDLLLWDTKSKEGVYSLPQTHLKQFKRYIRDSDRRVSCFLVIAPAIAEGADHTAQKLKIESKTDTDVALIAAEDLKWLAEEWARSKKGRFRLEVFNITGVLDRAILESRMKLFS
ncbi:hypothetical protein ACFL5T_03055 [Gemmatimonadota bacterium]